ncbi:MAG: DUF4229 domain-containing protein [Nocardioidaceae bacterium]
MKSFVVYTLARLGLFAVAFVLIWTVAGFQLAWNSVTVLWTALLALVISSIAALRLLRGLRNEFARTVQERAERMTALVEASRRKEDADDVD